MQFTGDKVMQQMKTGLPHLTLSPSLAAPYAHTLSAASATDVERPERVGPSVAFSNLKRQLRAERTLRAKAESERDQERADKLALQETLGHVLEGMNDGDKTR